MRATSHPYKALEQLPVWKVLDRGIADLVANGDLDEKTPRAYIVGYLAKLVSEANQSAFRHGEFVPKSKNAPQRTGAKNGAPR